MADAAAGAGQKHGAPWRIGGIHGRDVLARVITDIAAFGPGLIRGRAAEFDTVVQAERAVVPEFEPQRGDAPAAPARRPRHLADEIFGAEFRNRLFEGKAAFQRLRLLAGPGPDLGLFRPGREISVGFSLGYG